MQTTETQTQSEAEKASEQATPILRSPVELAVTKERARCSRIVRTFLDSEITFDDSDDMLRLIEDLITNGG